MALLSLRDVRLTLGGPPLLDGVALNIEEGERVCLLGRNGAGKSTLLKMIGGEISPDGGELALQKGARVAYLPQEVPEDMTGRVFDIVSSTHPQPQEHEVNAVLMRLQLDGDAEFEVLSGGLKRRVVLARALATGPDLLLLDEPTNHLDITSIAWLEEFLPRAVPSLLFVTHDRAFLQKMATRIVEIDRGKLSSWSCDYNTFLERKAAQLEAEEKQSALFDKRLAEEEAWIRRGVKARTTRNEGRVRSLEKMREERRARRNVVGEVRAQMQEADRSGHMVAETHAVSFGYDNKPIVRDLTVRIMRGDKVGIIGPNGSGKTTLLRLLLGQLEPQAGRVKLGTRLQIAYFDQLRAAIDEDASVQQNIAGENDTVLIDGTRRHIIGYLQEWLFSPERARTPARVLSGGERNRLLLAKLFTQPSNVLVMDEPTNDLDLETLELLEELLVNYSGTLLIVSHDRAFLNNVVTSTLAPLDGITGESNHANSSTSHSGLWREYFGGYDDYLRQSAAEKSILEAANAKAKPAAKSEAAPPKLNHAINKPRKLSFKETRELEALPARIEALEAEHAQLVEKMSDPEFYKGNAAQMVAANARLQEIEAEQTAAFARWEELEAVAALNAM
ncbi:MAG TPA: ATP-binding cassette domain-containing protein [Abditibacteriaceae bacterium]|jgi:ATP-binding cassette subfamily F protein uup